MQFRNTAPAGTAVISSARRLFGVIAIVFAPVASPELLGQNIGSAKMDFYETIQGQPIIADGVAGNPPGLLANDAGIAETSLVWWNGRGPLQVHADGTFSLHPHPNFIGMIHLIYRVPSNVLSELVGHGTQWRYLHPLDRVDPAVGDADFHQTWMTPEFDDSAWLPGIGPMGFGDDRWWAGTDIGTPVRGGPDGELGAAAYFRAWFTNRVPPNTIELDPLIANLILDDGIIVYLNGTEFRRINMEEGVPNGFRLLAPSQWPDPVAIDGELLSGAELRDGLNLIAISAHNAHASSGDMGVHIRSFGVPGGHGFIRVKDGQVPPQIEADEYHAIPGVVLDVGKDGHLPTLFANDGLIGPDGAFYESIEEVEVDTPSVGVILSFDKLTGGFAYQPPENFSGEAEFRYRVRDKDGWSESAQVRIVVQERHIAIPSARDDEYVMRRGRPLSMNVQPDSLIGGVVTNDEGISEVRILQSPTMGELFLHPDGSFVYDPFPDVGGTDVFEYVSSHARILVDRDATWRYLNPLDGVDPGVSDPDFHATWNGVDFDDAGWEEGTGLMAYGGIDFPDYVELPVDTVMQTPPSGLRGTAYFRHRFEAPPGPHNLTLEFSRDDAAIVYLNGLEILRSHEPGAVNLYHAPDAFGLMVESEGLASSGAAILGREGLVLRHIVRNVRMLDGANVLAISLHNSAGGTSSDLGMRFEALRSEAVGRVLITVLPANPLDDGYESWRERRFREVEDPSLADEYADPDLDGVENLLEYAFNRNPLVNETLGMNVRWRHPLPRAVRWEGNPAVEFWAPRLINDLVYELQTASELHEERWTTLARRVGASDWMTLSGVLLRVEPAFNSTVPRVTVSTKDLDRGGYWRIRVSRIHSD